MNLFDRTKRAKTICDSKTTAGPPPRQNPLDVIRQGHCLHSKICDCLEEIADGLPNRVDQDTCEKVTRFLQTELPLHHLDEEIGLFPLLRNHLDNEPELAEIIDHLSREHESDENYASELMEDLDQMSAGKNLENPDMVGYMLRGFFEGYRRHIAWENAVLLPLADRCLSKNDLDTLAACMVQNREEFGKLRWSAGNQDS